jgi:uncharacterized small protein (DUF1192 family)
MVRIAGVVVLAGALWGQSPEAEVARKRVGGELPLRVLLYSERIQRLQAEMERLTQQLQKASAELCAKETGKPSCRIVQIIEDEVVIEHEVSASKPTAGQ